jgi:adenosylhomocysteine nucleosidase
MTTAILSALPEEQQGLHERLSDTETIERAGRRFTLGRLHGQRVVLALAGVGKVAAAITATLLIEHFKVSRIVFTGVAGGLHPDVRVGDVVVGSHFIQHDMDASPLFPRHELPYRGISRIPADETLSAMLLEALRVDSMSANSHFSLKNAAIHHGLIATGDQFIHSADMVLCLRQAIPDGLCVEMEGAAVAQVCLDEGVAFAAMRSISDRADESAARDFQSFMAQHAGPLATRVMDTLMQRLTTQADKL